LGCAVEDIAAADLVLKNALKAGHAHEAEIGQA
jgi:ornithine cyclodeaminase/alanine dehydrogenase-like protein (mu-crystallin family)